ncbi:DUF748 domain-containing protein [Algoriphagus mannitolivorans]|uniref:DUF748 domain-containing protein n=1 Tax=Algoriphagus mannitolivorans TaxID=226504 RepID=UPI000408177C|nr:DUF748 domain-containing protein [Algoriphagus mannitolivorans]
MNRITKVLLVFFLPLILAGVGYGWYWQKWVNENLESLLNQNVESDYQFKLGEVDFRIFERSIFLKNLKIISLKSDTVSHVRGEIEQAFLKNVHLARLLLKKQLLIDELGFIHPTIQVNLFSNTDKKEMPESTLQHFFGDILSKGEIKNFRLSQGAAIFYEEGARKGTAYNLGILVNGLETDSIKAQYSIPFDYQRVYFSFDSLVYEVEEGQYLRLGKMRLDSKLERLSIKNISLLYQEELEKVARQKDFQYDLIELKMDSLKLSGFGPEIRLDYDFDVRARKLELFGLDLKDYRERRLPRPKDEVRPMFQGMISQVNFPLRLDTLEIVDSQISYGESVPGSGENWTIQFKEMNGHIINLTTIPEYQTEKKNFELDLVTSLEGSGNLKAKILVPYDKEEFFMDLDFNNYSLHHLNPMLRPIMNGEIAQGHLDRMKMTIQANEFTANVQLIFDYRDLKVELYNKTGQKKNKLLSGLANVAIHQSNLPGDKKYLGPNYMVSRNRTRGPFHLVWKSTKEGIMQVIPGGLAKELFLP